MDPPGNTHYNGFTGREPESRGPLDVSNVTDSLPVTLQTAPEVGVLGMIGARMIGSTLAKLWVDAGHQARVASRHPDQLPELVEHLSRFEQEYFRSAMRGRQRSASTRVAPVLQHEDSR
jgi:hypothetical protein